MQYNVAPTLSCNGVNSMTLFQPAIAFEPGMARREGGASRCVNNLSPTLRAEAGDNRVAVAYEKRNSADAKCGY